MAQLVFPLNVRAHTRTMATLSCFALYGLARNSTSGAPGGSTAMSVSSIILLIHNSNFRSWSVSLCSAWVTGIKSSHRLKRKAHSKLQRECWMLQKNEWVRATKSIPRRTGIERACAECSKAIMRRGLRAMGGESFNALAICIGSCVIR